VNTKSSTLLQVVAYRSPKSSTLLLNSSYATVHSILQ